MPVVKMWIYMVQNKYERKYRFIQGSVELNRNTLRHILLQKLCLYLLIGIDECCHLVGKV